MTRFQKLVLLGLLVILERLQSRRNARPTTPSEAYFYKQVKELL